MTKKECNQYTILCLDLGSKTGWALDTKLAGTFSGTIEFKNNRFEGGGMRYVRFVNWLQGIYNQHENFIIYFEEVRRHLGVDAAHAYGGFLSILTSFCEKHEIPYSGIPVGTIKKSATGKGNASKKMVMEAIIAEGFDPRDDNEADAIALLLHVKNKALI